MSKLSAVSSPLRLACAAVEFLTPLRLSNGLDDATIGRSTALFPFVGLLLGLALAGLDRLLAGIFPATIVDALLVAFLIVATGALHLDGLADTFDGVFGGRTPERRLEIMRDSRIGSFGTVAIALVLLLQWSALLALVSPWRRPALLLFPVLGRSAMVAALAAFPYARAQGLGVLFRAHVVPLPLLVAQLSALALSVICFGFGGLVLWSAAVLVAFGAGKAATGALGGLTGDVYGAIGEIVQIVELLMIVSAHRTGWLAPWLVRG